VKGNTFYKRFGKRPLDVTVAGAGLVLLSPVLVLVAAGVLVFLGRPVLFRQRRAGQRGRPFAMLKFRSMTDARDKEGRLLLDEVRLTAFGRLLRSTSLDELPNLWNVLKGDMSLVGPRPLPIEYVSLYTSEQAQRLNVLPGLVSLNGLYDRNAQSWERMFHYDVMYTAGISLREDARILLQMIPVILSCSGVERGRHDEESDFSRRLKAMQSREHTPVCS
jgi:sugar transferase EpsL